MNIRYNNFIETNWDRILYNSKVMNFAKNKQFLRKLIYSGKIATSQTRIPKFDIAEIGNEAPYNTNKFRHIYFKRLCEYIDVYQNKFGDDWDIHFQKNLNYENYYYIYLFKIFDKVTVTNYGRETSHNIRDLAVFNTVGMRDSGELWIPRMQGARLTYSSKEVISGYRHSHLGGISQIATGYSDCLSDFCIGGSSDTSLLSGLLTTSFSKEQFEIYLYAQDSTIECESDIGTPHIRFSKIFEKSEKSISMSVESVYLEKFKNILLRKVIDVNYYISNNNYYIKNDDVFHSFIKKFILDTLFDSDWKKILCKKGENDNYYSYQTLEKTSATSVQQISRDDADYNPPYIFYRGQKKEFKVAKEQTNKENNELKIEEFIVYPNLLNYIHGKLEHELQKKAIAGSNIKRYYSRNNVASYLR